MNYSNGRTSQKNERGKHLEDWVEAVNVFYALKDIALIQKIPTSWKFVNGRFFPNKKSTVDFLGIYGTRAIATDTKSTKNKTSFPLANIHQHQQEFLQQFERLGGLAFYLIYFEHHNRCFILFQSKLDMFQGWFSRKSIPLHWFEQHALEVDLTKNKFDYLENL